VDSGGDSSPGPGTVHGCFVDRDNNIWLTGNGDGIIQKWTHGGTLLMQIGKRGVFDSSDGTSRGRNLNASQTQFFNPAAVTVDPGSGDVYVADGYGNRRVAVFDRQGKFLRQWGHQATKEETEAGAGGAFAQIVHCITMSNEGLLYVCDRQGDRVQVFDKMGNFKRNIWVRTGTPAVPDPRGTAWWVAFSRDPAQKYLYVMNGRNEQLHVLDRVSGTILTSFGRPGHMLGNFTHGHTVAVDSGGSLYIAETDTGRRIQKFSPVKGVNEAKDAKDEVLARPAAAASARQYEEVKDWPRLPANVVMGEAAGVSVDMNGHVFVFHRPGRGFDTAATEKLKSPPVLELDAETGTLINAWGADTFLVPHGITIDQANNVFVTDVALQQVLKFTHDGKLLFALGEPRVGKWDATHFNEPTDIQIRADGSFYVSDGYVNSRVALFDKSGKWIQEWGTKGEGPGQFRNPHGISFVVGSTDVLVADRENSRLQLFSSAGAFKKQWVGVKDAQTTGRVFSVATDARGALYLGIRRGDYDAQHTGVIKLDRDWKVVASVGFGQPGDPVFNAVHDIVVGKDGSIYVAETRTKRVVKLRPVP
jgi:peptidylamidoglycolate lyase